MANGEHPRYPTTLAAGPSSHGDKSPIGHNHHTGPSPTAPARPTPAEAYANAHNLKRDKENHHVQPHSFAPPLRNPHPNNGGGGVVKTKPLFEWITRKLGAGRRVSYSDGPSTSRSSAPTTTTRGRGGGQSSRGRQGDNRKGVHGRPEVQGGMGKEGARSHLSPQQIFGPAITTRPNSMMTRSESHSLRSYSMSFANSAERDRRREANNPYPSIPVPLQRDSMVDTVSESFLSRSRTPSFRSERSRPRLSLAEVDDSTGLWQNRGEADEGASLRPFPPSHSSSPTPSHSILTRSASTSLLSPIRSTAPRSSSHVNRPRTQRSMSTSTGSSDAALGEEHQSRRDSSSTKPTTILSFDSGQHMAHIAQAPTPVPNGEMNASNTPLQHVAHTFPNGPRRHSHTYRSREQAAETQVDSPAPGGTAMEAGPSRTPTSPPSGLPDLSPAPSTSERESLNHAQAPKHSHPYPWDNPHPLSRPDSKTSMLTLASSTGANVPTPSAASASLPAPSSPIYSGNAATRLREVATSGPGMAQAVRPSGLATSPSVTFASETNAKTPNSTHEYASSTYTPSAAFAYPWSTYGQSIGNMSIRTGDWKTGEADRDASVRALRRKGSWESNESGWSWRGQMYGPPPPSTTASLNGSHANVLGYPVANRLSAYTSPEDDALSTHYATASGSLTRDSYMTAQTRLSKGSRGRSELGDEETPGVEDRRFASDRVGTPITA